MSDTFNTKNNSEIEGINLDKFLEKIKIKEKLVLVDFWAAWCNPCKSLAVQLEDAYKSIATMTNIYKVDIDTNQVLASKFHIKSIPMMIIFNNENIIDSKVGSLQSSEIVAWVTEVYKKTINN